MRPADSYGIMGLGLRIPHVYDVYVDLPLTLSLLLYQNSKTTLSSYILGIMVKPQQLLLMQRRVW